MKPGDVIEFDYELYVEGHEGLYDTTQRAKAEAAGIADEKGYYAPMRYVLGAGRIIPGLEKALMDATVGKEVTVDLTAAEAYGPRDPKQVETIPLAEFRKNKVKPEPGLVFNWGQRRGVVQTVGGGRVRVDFNSNLAGKALTYTFTVTRVFESPEDKITGLFLMNYPSPEEPKVAIEGEVAIVTLPDACKYDPNWPRAKFNFLASLQTGTDVARVRMLEEHELPRGEAEPAAE